MNIASMHQEFKILTDKIDSLNFPELIPEEIDVILNIAIERFVNQRAYGNNPRREGLEETQKRFDDLLTLITGTTITTFGTNPLLKPNEYSVALPSDHWHTINEEASINYIDCNGITQTKRIPVIPITHDRYNKIIRDPFNKPNSDKIIRLGLGGNITLITGQVTLNAYYLRYIRKPIQVQYGSVYPNPISDINCDLPESTHKEIVNHARSIALGVIESPNVNIADKEIITQE